MRFFESIEEKSSIWEIKFEDAVKEFWQARQQTQLIEELKLPNLLIEPTTKSSQKELKILNILIGHIIKISQFSLPEYFSIDSTKSLKDTLNLVFSKFGNFKTYWEYYINFYNKLVNSNEISNEDRFSYDEFISLLAKKTIEIEDSLISLIIYANLLNNDNLVTIPESLPLKFFDISQLKELIQKEENVDLLIANGTIDIFIKRSSSLPSIKHFLSAKAITEETHKDTSQKSTSYGSFGKS